MPRVWNHSSCEFSDMDTVDRASVLLKGSRNTYILSHLFILRSDFERLSAMDELHGDSLCHNRVDVPGNPRAAAVQLH